MSPLSRTMIQPAPAAKAPSHKAALTGNQNIFYLRALLVFCFCLGYDEWLHEAKLTYRVGKIPQRILTMSAKAQ